MLPYAIPIGKEAPAPPLLANAWLNAWEKIGGGVTIGPDNSLNPWLLAQIPDATDTSRTLINQIADTPGLALAIRIVLRAGRQRKAQQA